MSKNPQPFRTYAGFLLDIVNDPWRAQQLLDKATELEEAQSAVHADDALSFLDGMHGCMLFCVEFFIRAKCNHYSFGTSF